MRWTSLAAGSRQALGDFDERAEILGEATAAEAEPGIEEPAAMRCVMPAVGHLEHVSAEPRDHRDGVDVEIFRARKELARADVKPS
jgi:hypothetical protein